MMPKRKEILVRLQKLLCAVPSDPESPFPDLRPRQKHGPATTVRNLHGVPMERPAKPDGASGNPIFAIGRYVPVAATQHERDEPPRMIMVSSRIIGCSPVVNPEREQAEIEDPPSQVRALGQSELLPPTRPRGWI